MGRNGILCLGGYRIHKDIPALPCLRYETSTPMLIKASYPKNPITIGEHIRKKRMDLDLYQSDVGRSLGVSKDCVTNWENGRNHPLISYYPKIIKFLGYNPFLAKGRTFGERIFAYRCTNGMSSKKFAKLIGISQYAVLALEANKGAPRKETLFRVNQIIREDD